MNKLAGSKRCSLFKNIATDVWKAVIKSHNVTIHKSEIGITDDIIAEIRTNAAQIPNIGVWANPSHKENVHGNDIDVFVETRSGEFVWWALQAKVLYNNEAYNDLFKKKQWEKLKLLSTRTGCISRYLFYNGIGRYSYVGIDKCGLKFSEDQFGCSLVEPETVEQFSKLNKNKFDDFHPNYAEPWRIITCCYTNTSDSDIKIYFLDQIKDSLRYYEASAGNTNLITWNDESDSLYDFNINEENAEIGRVPAYRAVIRTTSSLEKIIS